MNLTDEQKNEIQGYIITVPKYRETYNELYDHILTSLADQDGTFHIDLVTKIVNDDFGGFNEIADQEQIYHKEIGKKFNRQFRLQFIDTLKWQGIGVLVICFMLYYSHKTTPFYMKPLVTVSMICLMSVALFGYARIIVNVIRFSKLSILDGHLAYASSFSFATINLVLGGFINGHILELSDNNKLIAIFFLFSFASVYAITFAKLYTRKLNILIA
ncbi:MAG: hypothetical protein EOO43_10115 [Flavobacterium sp.]|nr:MAG: hypothetical protein EOO43_10115 [Flavobacterium sp.]